MMRGITGLGAGNGPFISIHDGFAGAANWADFLPGSDRIALDIHPYLAFSAVLLPSRSLLALVTKLVGHGPQQSASGDNG